MILWHQDSAGEDWYFSLDAAEPCRALGRALQRDRVAVATARDRLRRALDHASENVGNTTYEDAIGQLGHFLREAREREKDNLRDFSASYAASYEEWAVAPQEQRWYV